MADIELVDAHGKAVLKFSSEARNLSKVRLLHELIFSMYDSGDWREYTNAAGHYRWRECEFDYFLIHCDIKRDDAYGVFAYQRGGHHVAEGIASDDPRKRRPLEKVSDEVRLAGSETLAARAQRLGWVSDRGGMVPAMPVRQLVKARTGMTKDEAQRTARREKLGERRAVLDQAVAALAKRFSDPAELRYLVDELHRVIIQQRGRPVENAQWQRDAQEFKRDPVRLARHWKISKARARARLKRLD